MHTRFALNRIVATANSIDGNNAFNNAAARSATRGWLAPLADRARTIAVGIGAVRAISTVCAAVLFLAVVSPHHRAVVDG
jgi:hypothetical protein